MNQTYIAIILAILVIGGIYLMGKRSAPRKPYSASGPPAPLDFPKPARPPFSAPTWSVKGDWAIPFNVRYAIAYADGQGNQGPLSDWTPYYSSAQFSNPILSRFPVTLQDKDGEKIKAINIYPF